MHENILATVIRLDEAKALLNVKPLHSSFAAAAAYSQDRFGSGAGRAVLYLLLALRHDP
jgi:hypothetical protein